MGALRILRLPRKRSWKQTVGLRSQALLSAVGNPIGLAFGYGAGVFAGSVHPAFDQSRKDVSGI